jgi:hypothetical protein
MEFGNEEKRSFADKCVPKYNLGTRGKIVTIFWELILRQAQDDGLVRQGLLLIPFIARDDGRTQ